MNREEDGYRHRKKEGQKKTAMEREREEFAKKFDTECKEIIVLTEDGTCAGRAGKEKLWKASAKILAYVDEKTGKLRQEKAFLSWQMTEEERQTKERIFGIKKESIYRLRVRESLPFTNAYTGEEMKRGYNLWVMEVLARDCHEERLENILAEYRKPVKLHPVGCGELLLDKSLGMYDGEGTWNGGSCRIHLDVDGEGMETAEDSVHTLQKLMEHCADWDKKARRFAAKELTELANDWQDESGEEEEAEITEEEFAERLHISEVCVSVDGDFEIYYDDDDMFWGHVVVVSGNIDHGISDATMEG